MKIFQLTIKKLITLNNAEVKNFILINKNNLLNLILLLLGLPSLLFAEPSMAPNNLSIDSSNELICRNHAKEMASLTYKNCLSENSDNLNFDKSTINKSSSEKLMELKNIYENKLAEIQKEIQSNSSIPQSIDTESMSIKLKPITDTNNKNSIEKSESKLKKSIKKVSKKDKTTKAPISSSDKIEIQNKWVKLEQANSTSIKLNHPPVLPSSSSEDTLDMTNYNDQNQVEVVEIKPESE